MSVLEAQIRAARAVRLGLMTSQLLDEGAKAVDLLYRHAEASPADIRAALPGVIASRTEDLSDEIVVRAGFTRNGASAVFRSEVAIAARRALTILLEDLGDDEE